MLRSKATAALMKLKEIDRKYKIRCSEDVKVLSSLSDISTIDGGDDVSNHVVEPAGSGDRPDSIITSRPKLDVRMPDAHMERAAAQGTESELVTIFNKPPKKLSPKLDSDISRNIITVDKTVEEPNAGLVGEENEEKLQMVSLENSLTISEEKIDNTETSISEDVPEVVLYSHPKTNSSEEITLKSVGSMSDVEERVQSDVDEDPSTLVASGTYSDDFVKSFSETSSRARDLQSSGNARESRTRPGKSIIVTRTEDPDPELTSPQVKYLLEARPGVYERRCSPGLNKMTQPETEENVEQISAKVLRVVRDSDSSLDSSLSNFVKKTDRSGNKQAENPVYLLQRSSQSSSARSSEERRSKRRPPVSSCRDSSSLKSRELSSNSGQTKKSEARNSSGSSDPFESNLHSSLIPPESNCSGVLETTRPQDTQFTVLFARKHEKELKNSETVSFLEAKSTSEDHHETDDKEVLRKPKKQAAAVIRRKKLGLKVNSKIPKNRIRDEDSSIEEPPPNYSADYPMQKCKSAIQPVSIALLRPVSEFIQSPNDDEVARSAKRSSKDRAIHREKKRPVNKQKIGVSLRSKHRNETERISQCKTRVIEEPGRRDVERLKQQINELRLQQERDQLRARVRGYVHQLMNEKQGLLARDDGFRGSIDQCDYSRSATGSRQSESLRSFFKPLDLPNVAAFKRPDFEDEKAADLDSVRYLHLRMVRERVLDIRHWLKQQFVLYRDYSSLVVTINAKYTPVTLKDTKKMIRDMQRFRNNCERRRHVR